MGVRTPLACLQVLGSLACAVEFRKALMSDGALQPILQLLHAPSLPTRTAAVRALAIMSQQLMAPSLPPDDPSALELVAALFESSTIPKLLAVLNEPTSLAPDEGGETGERQLIAVLLLLQNLAGGHGNVRPRLVEAGAVEALLAFLSARSAPADKAKHVALSSPSTSGEILGAAAWTLANLALAPGGSEKVAHAGSSKLLALLQSRSPELQVIATPTSPPVPLLDPHTSRREGSLLLRCVHASYVLLTYCAAHQLLSGKNPPSLLSIDAHPSPTTCRPPSQGR